MDTITKEQKVKFLHIAANVAGVGLDERLSDLIVSLYEIILEKQEDLTIKEILSIMHEAKQRADVKARQYMLDQVSQKIER